MCYSVTLAYVSVNRQTAARFLQSSECVDGCTAFRIILSCRFAPFRAMQRRSLDMMSTQISYIFGYTLPSIAPKLYARSSHGIPLRVLIKRPKRKSAKSASLDHNPQWLEGGG
ncbi:hypothetical protein ACLKA6_009787 [Drosophila palustris]